MATPDFQSPTATRAFSRVNLTPRPTPSFGAENSFSHRRKTPFRAPRPPRPPTKSCPPVSRIFKNADQETLAHAVSFKNLGNPVMESPLYMTDSPQLYFEQCFEIRQKLGEGSFGEVYQVRALCTDTNSSSFTDAERCTPPKCHTHTRTHTEENYFSLQCIFLLHTMYCSVDAFQLAYWCDSHFLYTSFTRYAFIYMICCYVMSCKTCNAKLCIARIVHIMPPLLIV